MANDVDQTLTATLEKDTGLSPTDGLTFDPTIRGIATAGAVVVFADGDRPLGSVTADAGGAYRFRPTDLTQGTHRITVTDLATSEEAGVEMTLDTLGPTLGLALSSGTSTASDPNGNQPLMQNEDGSALVLNAVQFGRSLRVGGLVGGVELGRGLKATVTLVGTDGHTFAKAVTVVSNSYGDYYAFRIDRPADPALSSMIDGTYTVIASVSDLAGNTASTAAIGLVIDTTADAGAAAGLTVEGTGDGVVNAAEAAAVTLTLTGLDDDSTAVATVSDGTHVKTVAMSANATVTVDLSGFDGEVTTSLAVRDVHGNATSLSGGGATLDTAAPVAPSLALLADTGADTVDGVTRDGRLAPMATEPGGSLRYVVDGGAPLSHYDPDDLAEGFHTIAVSHIDSAGNLSPAQTLSLTLDRIAPAVTATRYVISVGSEGAQITVTGETEASTGTTVRLRDGTTDLAFATLDGAGGWSASGLLGVGSHTLSAVATDLAGNVTVTPDLPRLADGAAVFAFGLPDARITISADEVTVVGPDFVQTVLSGVTRLGFSDKALLTSASYALGDGEDVAAFAVLDEDASAPIDLTGNAGAQTITGNAGANRLDGGAGADVMRGGLGNDTYVLDALGDRVFELTGQGTDLVLSSVTHTLGAFVENLTLTGTGAITATGNSLANTLRGNDGANRLDGETGADVMRGGLGNDTYVVDDLGDKVFELISQGVDLVLSSVSFNLGGQYVENLTLTGTSVVSATGNSFANTLVGNAGANTLSGGSGDDVLNGAGGNDFLNGGAGRDTFSFTTPTGIGNVDRIADFSVPDDTIRLARSVFTALGAGTLAEAAFKDLSTGAADASDRILYDKTTGGLSYDADGSGAASAAVRFAIIDTKAALTHLDFLVV